MNAVWHCQDVKDVKAAVRFKSLLFSSVFDHLEFILNIPDMVYWKNKLSSVDWKKEDIFIDFDLLFCFFLGEILKSVDKSFNNKLVVSKHLEGFSYVLSTDVDFHLQSAWTAVCYSRAIDIIAAKLLTVRGGRLKCFRNLCVREDGALSFPCENLDNKVIGKLTYYTTMLLRQESQLLSKSGMLWESRIKSRRYYLFEALGFEFFQWFKFPSLIPLKVDSSRVKGWRTSHGEIKFSSRSLKALEFSDSKAFFVNPDCIALFEKLLFDPAQDIEFVSDFPTVGCLEALELEISRLEASIDFDRCFGYSRYKQVLNDEGSLGRVSARIHALSAFNLDEDMLASYRKWMKRKALLKSLIDRWREYLSNYLWRRT